MEVPSTVGRLEDEAGIAYEDVELDNLDNAEAVGAVQWLISKVVAAVENNEAPGATSIAGAGGCRSATGGTDFDSIREDGQEHGAGWGR
jgi:hypothetical protein